MIERDPFFIVVKEAAEVAVEEDGEKKPKRERGGKKLRDRKEALEANGERRRRKRKTVNPPFQQTQQTRAVILPPMGKHIKFSDDG